MMPSNKHDPYQELEAYLRQAQAEVGRAVEDLLASESTGSSSSCSGSRKNSCPDLYSIGVPDNSYRTPGKFVAAYTSLSAPRPRRSVNGIGGSSSEKAPSTTTLWSPRTALEDAAPATEKRRHAPGTRTTAGNPCSCRGLPAVTHSCCPSTPSASWKRSTVPSPENCSRSTMKGHRSSVAATPLTKALGQFSR
ncbi:hypothetical protein MRX96_022791 [Rhipicephalus microplus]